MADRWVPPPGSNAYNYHCSCWQRVSHGHSNVCNERLVKQLAETQAQLTQAQAEIARLSIRLENEKAMTEEQHATERRICSHHEAEVFRLTAERDEAEEAKTNSGMRYEAQIAALREQLAECGRAGYPAARAKLKETTGG